MRKLKKRNLKYAYKLIGIFLTVAPAPSYHRRCYSTPTVIALPLSYHHCHHIVPPPPSYRCCCHTTTAVLSGTPTDWLNPMSMFYASEGVTKVWDHFLQDNTKGRNDNFHITDYCEIKLTPSYCTTTAIIPLLLSYLIPPLPSYHQRCQYILGLYTHRLCSEYNALLTVSQCMIKLLSLPRYVQIYMLLPLALPFHYCIHLTAQL